MPGNKHIILSNDTMRGLDRIDQKYDRQLFILTLNGFFIDGGLLPDIPIGMHPGQFKNKAGIWMPGVRYTQYVQWEPMVENLFDIKIIQN